MRTRLAVVLILEEPPPRRTHPKRREIRARDDLGPDRLRPLPRRGREVHRLQAAAEDALEEPVLLLQVAADRVRHQVVAAAVVRERLALPVDEDEALRLSDGQEAEEHL